MAGTQGGPLASCSQAFSGLICTVCKAKHAVCLMPQKCLVFIQQGLQQALVAHATTHLAFLIAPALPPGLVPATLIPPGLALPNRGHGLRQAPVGHQPVPACMGGSTQLVLRPDT